MGLSASNMEHNIAAARIKSLINDQQYFYGDSVVFYQHQHSNLYIHAVFTIYVADNA